MIGVCVYRNREFVLATISYKSFVARSLSLFLNGPWPFRLCVYFRMFIPHRSLSCRLYGILFFSHGSYSWRPSVRLLFLDISPMSSGTENTCQFFQDSVSLLFFSSSYFWRYAKLSSIDCILPHCIFREKVSIASEATVTRLTFPPINFTSYILPL